MGRLMDVHFNTYLHENGRKGGVFNALATCFVQYEREYHAENSLSDDHLCNLKVKNQTLYAI